MKVIRCLSILVLLALAGLSTPVVYMGSKDDDSPRLKCLKKCQAEHLTCLKNAGTDQTAKSVCNKSLSTCEKACPKP